MERTKDQLVVFEFLLLSFKKPSKNENLSELQSHVPGLLFVQIHVWPRTMLSRPPNFQEGTCNPQQIIPILKNVSFAQQGFPAHCFSLVIVCLELLLSVRARRSLRLLALYVQPLPSMPILPGLWFSC